MVSVADFDLVLDHDLCDRLVAAVETESLDDLPSWPHAIRDLATRLLHLRPLACSRVEVHDCQCYEEGHNDGFNEGFDEANALRDLVATQP